MLLRKHIHGLLSSYYNQPHHAVVGSIIHHHQKQNDITQSPINFANILGEWHWRYIFQKLYKQQTGQWLTPVELFKPFYSQIIGNFIATEASIMKQKNTNLDKNDFGSVNDLSDLVQIVEIGGGRGTNALCILDHLKSKHPDVYRNIESYTIMDSSPTLLNHVKQLLVDGSSHIGNQENMASTSRHNDKIIIKQVDMLDVAEKRLVKSVTI